MLVDLTCPDCDKGFETEWLMGDTVTCPLCKTEYETDWDTNFDDDIQGPWIEGKVAKP
ncbi:hypothetical protein LCGC14_0734050 [marine sediment metagenome]|uniref:Lysine biosynthesis protein LysW n=1 Tax=marine sediment metagenome TaxID=412755 RepID=A0A0F9TFY0_9ZZZZ